MKPFASLKTRFVVWVWNHTPTCAEMSRLTSRALEQPLTLRMRVKMRLHFVICAWCRRYLKHLKFLRTAARRFDEHLDLPAARGLSAEAKRRIVQRLQTG